MEEIVKRNVNAKKIVETLKVLANESRLLIFCCLMEKPLTVAEMHRHVPKITDSAFSQHLTLLKAHGILDSEKSGQHVTYSIADNRVVALIDVLRKNYC
ncbi:MAG: metalloregulator ArsR/SmtB family transcription factor [Peptococcaceae bacterium]|nr:metalloregulator ArsR/SmtB family transcription factor [Peptococcaceae bacterium]